MPQQRTSIALRVSIFVLGVLVGGWFVLNHYRVQYYNDSIEGPAPQMSPYWNIVHVQNLLLWPILIVTLCVVALTLFKLAQWIARLIANRRRGSPGQ